MTIEIAWTTVSSLCNYSVARLSFSSGQSRNRIQDTCCSHTRSWSNSLCECCVVARIVTNNVASEYKITFVLFWNVLFHFIFQMNLHPWALAKCARFPSFIAWRIKSDLLCLPLFHHMLEAFSSVLFSVHCSSCFRDLHCLRHWNQLVNLIVMSRTHVTILGNMISMLAAYAFFRANSLKFHSGSFCNHYFCIGCWILSSGSFSIHSLQVAPCIQVQRSPVRRDSLRVRLCRALLVRFYVPASVQHFSWCPRIPDHPMEHNKSRAVLLQLPTLLVLVSKILGLLTASFSIKTTTVPPNNVQVSSFLISLSIEVPPKCIRLVDNCLILRILALQSKGLRMIFSNPVQVVIWCFSLVIASRLVIVCLSTSHIS